MIENIIELLKLSEHLAVSENIEIAKGKYKLHRTSVKKAYKQKIREIKYNRK